MVKQLPNMNTPLLRNECFVNDSYVVRNKLEMTDAGKDNSYPRNTIYNAGSIIYCCKQCS